MKFNVTVLIDAGRNIDVDADTAEQAADKALDAIGYASVCHQCAKELDVGDALGAVVYDGTDQVLDTTYSGQRVAELEAEIAMLKAKIAILESTREA